MGRAGYSPGPRRATGAASEFPRLLLGSPAIMRNPSILFVLGLTATACSDDLPTAEAEVYFSRTDGCAARVRGLAVEAESSIWAAVYSFTDDDIAKELVAAVGRGVEVWVVVEKSQRDGSVIGTLERGGVEIKVDGNGKAMHHKFAVIDQKVVATGSFNWTINGEHHNDENLVVLHSEELARSFGEEFLRVWDMGKSP